MLIVLDTNVLVSGSLHEDGIPGKIVDLVIARKIRLAVDEHIMREYETVVARPRLGIPLALRNRVISQFTLDSTWVEAQSLIIQPGNVPDLTDLPFAEVAVAAGVNALVTGNPRHFPFLDEYGVKVLTPAEFIGQL